MVLRKATLDDMNELIKIRLGYLKEGFGGLTSEQTDQIKQELPAYYTKHLGSDFIAYIAVDKDVIVSSVFLVVIEKPANPNFLTGKIGNILNVFTNLKYRKQGLASQLLKLAIEEAKSMHLSYLELMATEKGYPLYKKFGFVEPNTSHVVPMKLKL